MIELKKIYKEYLLAEDKVIALNDISLTFRDNEFISILGPSGCGKTTLLNIIGGLDKYTSGELSIDGKTTKDFREKEWDSYRNSSVGFVFQSYNLIPHLTVLENVTMALSLSGVSAKEAKKRAIKALKEVELENHIKKRPNQLSGGQMQRVAIARALVNDPKILLADEPTGALDTETSVKIMELIKKISKNRLVIMVTHNPDLAEIYSDRIINILDGQIMGDSNPVKESKKSIKKTEKLETKKTTMPFSTAVKSSTKNLMNKKGRTITTSIAGSIGIVGIAVVLAISNGMSGYVAQTEREILADSAISVTESLVIEKADDSIELEVNTYPDDLLFHPTPSDDSTSEIHYNNLSSEYLNYIAEMDESLYNTITYENKTNLNLIFEKDGYYNDISSINSNTNVLSSDLDYVKSQYDLLSGHYPENKNEILLVVNSDNQIDPTLLSALGFDINTDKDISAESLVGITFTSVSNDSYYTFDGAKYQKINDQTSLHSAVANADSTNLEIVGIVRANQDSSSYVLNRNIIYTEEFMNDQILLNQSSAVVIAQENSPSKSVITGNTFASSSLPGFMGSSSETYDATMRYLGAYSYPSAIRIYPAGFDASEEIKNYLSAYNIDENGNEKPVSSQVIYSTSFIETMLDSMSSMIDTISLLLSAFAAISLVVSSIMIGIITYVSVIERTKEIGVLRAIGARKKDVSRIFNAESLLIGIFAGVIGLITTGIVGIIATPIISSLVGSSFVVSLSFTQGAFLLLLSMGLTFVSGLIPAKIASKKDPIIALRS